MVAIATAKKQKCRQKSGLALPRKARPAPLGKPGAEKKAHQNGCGAAVRDRDEAKKSPAKLVTEIKSQTEVKKG